MYTPHTVTLYYITEDPVTFTTTNHITVLRGVFMEASKAANVKATGLEGADSVNLYIPFSVEAFDGMTGTERKYIGPKAYADADNKDSYWTIDVDINCFFVKGEIIEPTMNFQTINTNYDDVHRVTKVDMFDFGSEDMRHWEVGGA